MEKINLEEIFNEYYEMDCDHCFTKESIILAMKMACKKALKLTSKRVEETIEKSEEEIYIGLAQEINNSILDTINQIE